MCVYNVHFIKIKGGQWRRQDFKKGVPAPQNF